MIKQYSYKELTWYDLESPTSAEVDKLCSLYDLNSIVKEELKTPTLKPISDTYDNCLYVILHFPSLKPHIKNFTQEIDFVIGKDFHYYYSL